MERFSRGEPIATPIRIRDVVRLLTSPKSAQRRPLLEYCARTLTIHPVSNGGAVSLKSLAAELFTAMLIPLEPEHIRSDNGPEFTAKAVRRWLNRLGVKTLFMEPGSPRENGYIESFNGKLRDELLNREIFTTLEEAKVLIEQWRKEYNQVRPHSALRYRPPAPEVVLIMT